MGLYPGGLKPGGLKVGFYGSLEKGKVFSKNLSLKQNPHFVHLSS